MDEVLGIGEHMSKQQTGSASTSAISGNIMRFKLVAKALEKDAVVSSYTQDVEKNQNGELRSACGTPVRRLSPRAWPGAPQ